MGLAFLAGLAMLATLAPASAATPKTPLVEKLLADLKTIAPQLNSAKYQWFAKSIQNTGVEVFEVNYRWQVAIQVDEGTGWRCGGILISKDFVLTAAHCVDGNTGSTGPARPIDRSKIQLFHGSDEFGQGTPLAIDPNWPVVVHPNWRKLGIGAAYDAAILRLKSPLGNSITAPVRRPAMGEGKAIVSGWGDFDARDTPSKYLRAVALPVVNNDICKATLAGRSEAAWIGDWSLCTISKTDDACARDSGGPLVIGSALRPQTVGIVSWGAQRTCGVANSIEMLVGVYTRTSAIADWIVDVTGDPATVTSETPAPLFTISERNDR